METDGGGKDLIFQWCIPTGIPTPTTAGTALTTNVQLLLEQLRAMGGAAVLATTFWISFVNSEMLRFDLIRSFLYEAKLFLWKVK